MVRRHRDFIGVFDSGVGGISVLARLAKELPNEDFVFYGDSANAPYGERNRDWIERRSRDIVEHLMDEGAKAIVIACNTATSCAATTLRADYAHIPIIGVEPALKPATLAKDVETILVMATPITLRLDKFQRLAERWGGDHQVINVPCPGLAGRIEKGDLDAPDVEDMIRGFVGDYVGSADAVVLGCTHYPFVADAIRAVLGDVQLFDGASGTARQLHRKLAERGLLTKSSDAGVVNFESSSVDPHELDLYRSFYEAGCRLS